MVKYIFAKPKRKELTRSLINSVFEQGGMPLIVDFDFPDRERSPNLRFGKTSLLTSYTREQRNLQNRKL